MPTRQPKCPHCKRLFLPHPASRLQQRYCSDAPCQKARKAASNRRFRRRNPDYFKGPIHVERVRAWRRTHPGYWRNERRNQRQSVVPAGSVPSAAATLQAELMPQPVDPAVVELRGKVDALQAVSDRQVHIIHGLAAHLTGYALQADLGVVLNAWYDKGSRLSGLSPAQETAICRESNREPAMQSSAGARAPPVHPESLQLGRPSPGA